MTCLNKKGPKIYCPPPRKKKEHLITIVGAENSTIEDEAHLHIMVNLVIENDNIEESLLMKEKLLIGDLIKLIRARC